MTVTTDATVLAPALPPALPGTSNSPLSLLLESYFSAFALPVVLPEFPEHASDDLRADALHVSLYSKDIFAHLKHLEVRYVCVCSRVDQAAAQARVHAPAA